MLDWLRRRICRCPEPEPMIQVTGNTLFGFDLIAQYQAEGSVAPWPPDLPQAVKPRHLHAVTDEDEQ